MPTETRRMKKTLGIVGLLLAGFAGCGAADEACSPSGTWIVTASPTTGDTCGDTPSTGTRVISVVNGTATITDPSDGSSNQGGLDSSCHLAYVEAISTTDFIATGQTDWTFKGSSLSGTVSAHVTATADGSMCTLSESLVGARQ